MIVSLHRVVPNAKVPIRDWSGYVEPGGSVYLRVGALAASYVIDIYRLLLDCGHSKERRMSGTGRGPSD